MTCNVLSRKHFNPCKVKDSKFKQTKLSSNISFKFEFDIFDIINNCNGHHNCSPYNYNSNLFQKTYFLFLFCGGGGGQVPAIKYTNKDVICFVITFGRVNSQRLVNAICTLGLHTNLLQSKGSLQDELKCNAACMLILM